MTEKKHIAKRDINAWLSYFETLHPVGIDMGLARVAAVWQTLCQTHVIDKIATQKVITVAGTNGKGSACQMLSLLLSAQGYRVGMYTSPHIHHFSERVKINGVEVVDDLLIQAFEAIETARGQTTLSYFEATTLVGLLVFAWQNVDFAVLEVGLGGRLDAINIIDADAALITSIGLDHEAFLGNDVAKIAVEKAGICRPHRPAVYAQTPLYDDVVSYCQQQSIPLFSLGRDYHIEVNHVVWQNQRYPLPNHVVAQGQHQVQNAAGVVVLLATLGLLPDDFSALNGFALPGRLQQIANHPNVIIDVGHNEAAAIALADFIRQQRPHYRRIYGVVGMLADKNHHAVLRIFDGLFDAVFIGSTDGERGFSAMALASIAENALTCPVTTSTTLPHALQAAKATAHADDLILAFGSFLVVEALTANNQPH